MDGWVAVYANDSDEVLWLVVDDMHPASRIRRTIESNAHKSSFHFVNVSRDTMRSIVASQRHNALLPKGDCDERELRLELDRDCVDVVPHLLTHDSADVRHVVALARQLVSVLLSWPRLYESTHTMEAGNTSDWHCGPLHFDLCFAIKTDNVFPKCRTAVYRMTNHIIAFMLRMRIPQVFRVSWWLDSTNLEIVTSAIERAMHNDPWFVEHDQNGMIDADVRSIFDGILEARSTSDVALDLLLYAKGLLRKVPNTAQIFGPDMLAPEMRLLERAFDERGWTFTLPPNADPSKAIVFPTYMYSNYEKTGPVIRLTRALNDV